MFASMDRQVHAYYQLQKNIDHNNHANSTDSGCWQSSRTMISNMKNGNQTLPQHEFENIHHINYQDGGAHILEQKVYEITDDDEEAYY